MPPPRVDLASEPDLKVVTYRRHHNAFPAATSGDRKDVLVIDRAVAMPPWRRFVSFFFNMFMIHYFLWIFGMIAVLYAFYACGLWYISVLLLALYTRSFLDNSQFKSGRPWDALRRSNFWRLTSRYLGVEVVRTKKLDPSKKYVFGLYPHGILILSRVTVYGGVWELMFPGIETRVLAASPMFWLPGARDLCLWMGAINAAKKVAVKAIEKFKLNLLVYPGGSDEIFETDPNSSVTTLIARKGWIKLAVQSGASLVPAFVFGEKWLYHRKPISEGVRKWFMRNLRTPLIVFWGRFFTWLPYHDNKKAFLSIVFGAPIDVEQQADPSDEYIDSLWQQYETAVRAIYDEYKGKYGYPADETLVFKEARSSGPSRSKKTE